MRRNHARNATIERIRVFAVGRACTNGGFLGIGRAGRLNFGPRRARLYPSKPDDLRKPSRAVLYHDISQHLGTLSLDTKPLLSYHTVVACFTKHFMHWDITNFTSCSAFTSGARSIPGMPYATNRRGRPWCSVQYSRFLYTSRYSQLSLGRTVLWLSRADVHHCSCQLIFGIARILKHQDGVINIIDDVHVFGPIEKQYEDRLKKVFPRHESLTLA